MTEVSADTLQRIIADATEAFPEARLDGMGVCNCGVCMDDAAQARMAKAPRMDISDQMLREWFDAATGDSGLVPLKIATHLSPRIFSMIEGNEDVSDVEMYLSRFAYTDGDRWTEEQQNVATRFQVAFVETFRGDARSIDPMLDDVLCMFAKGGFDLQPILDQIDRWPAADLVNRFWVDWCSWCAPSVWRTAFWNPVANREAEPLGEAQKQSATWYKTAGRRALDEIFRSLPEDDALWQRAADVEVALAAYDGD